MISRTRIRATTISSITCDCCWSTFAERLARAFTGEDFATVFADPDCQLSLFATPLETIRPVLTTVSA